MTKTGTSALRLALAAQEIAWGVGGLNLWDLNDAALRKYLMIARDVLARADAWETVKPWENIPKELGWSRLRNAVNEVLYVLA
jgi:hypothetical protein